MNRMIANLIRIFQLWYYIIQFLLIFTEMSYKYVTSSYSSDIKPLLEPMMTKICDTLLKQPPEKD